MKETGNIWTKSTDSVAQTCIGQKLLVISDKVLTILDDCLQWSLPTHKKSEEKNGELFIRTHPNRPLPWILFLPTLLMLRIIRFCVNTCFYFIGMNSVEPVQMIRMLRTVRRQLNKSRMKGLKETKRQKDPNHQSTEKDRTERLREATKRLAESLRLSLSSMACIDAKPQGSPPPTQICVSNIFDKVPLIEDPTDSEESPDIERFKSSLSEALNFSDDGEDEDEDEGVISQLNRLADIPSEEDPDFEPNEENESDALSEEFSNDSIMSEEEKIPDDEVEDLKKDCKNIDYEALLPRNPNFALQEPQIKSFNNKLIIEEKNQSGEFYSPSTNGNGDEHEDAYYSPISWKSVSPDVSLPYEKHVEFIEHEKRAVESSNGEILNNDKIKKVDDSPGSSVNSKTVGDVGNGHIKEKRQTTSHSGKRHHQKTKRGYILTK